MIQNQEEELSEAEAAAQLEHYRRRNQQLRRQLREKDARIMQLFESIDQASSKLTLSQHSQLAPSPNIKSYSPAVKLPQSESKPQKRTTTVNTNKESGNIFRQENASVVWRASRKELRLPVLEKRSNWIYPREDSIIENPEGKPKLVRIPMDRLKPLNSREVKLRFLMKFQPKEESHHNQSK